MKKNKLVCPFCGAQVEHTVTFSQKQTPKGWEVVEEKHVFKCPYCYTGEFEMNSLEEFQEYCAWRDTIVNRFIILVDNENEPSISIGVALKDLRYAPGEWRPEKHNFHPSSFVPGLELPRPQHKDKVFLPAQREEAIALYRKFVKEYLEAKEGDYVHKIGSLLGMSAKVEYPKLWRDGIALLRRFDEQRLEQSFAKFLRFLHEYDTLVKDYPKEKDQIEHLSDYCAWLYQEGDCYPNNACLKGHEKELEEKLLKEFKKTHK